MSGIQGVDKLLPRLNSLVPDFVQAESPEFVAFLKAYFEFLEHETVVLKSQSTIDNVGLEDGSSLLYETATISPSTTADNKILLEQTVDNPNTAADPFTIGEYLVGNTSKTVAKINVVNGNQMFVKTISGFGFKNNETVTGRTSGQTGIVSTYKESSIRANNKILEYSDVDKTTEAFLEYFQKDFMPSLDASLNSNKRSTIKHIRDLYQKKGSPDSLKFLLRLLYGQEAEVSYPYDNTIKSSDSSYASERRMVVNIPIEKDRPQATDTITEYEGGVIYAQGIVNIVYPVVGSDTLFSLDITNIASKEFRQGSDIELVDRDTKEKRAGTVSGIISTFNDNDCSIYLAHDDDGDILLEDGGGLLLEASNASIGSLYAINDDINFQGSKTEFGSVGLATSVVEGIQTGSVEEVYIETSGSGYEGGDLVIFDNTGTNGSGAFGMIGSAGDELFQEAGTRFGYYQFTATAGQTVFSGYDNYGQQVIYEDHNRRVFVNDVEQTTGFSTQGSVLTFNSGLSNGDQVEIYTEFMRITLEDGSPVNLETTNSNIRKVTLINGGRGYSTLPLCGPGGYIYPASITGFTQGEVVTGAGGATAVIGLVNKEKNRLEVYRRSTDSGSFVVGETLTGGGSGSTSTILQQNVSSGTGAKLFAFSKSIGRVGTLNIKAQGHTYTSDAHVAQSSTYPMLISEPSVALTKDTIITGSVSGSTARVLDFNSNTQLLKVQDMTNMFLENESVTFPNGGTFKIHAFNPFTGRGTKAGEGFINKGTTSDVGALSASGMSITDSKFYQSHSYVVRIGESINKFRSIVKDLVHPAGHIFFGEVAVTNNVSMNVADADHVRFRPTIVINAGGDDTANAEMQLAARTGQQQEVEIYSLSTEEHDLAYAPMIALVNESIPSPSTDPRTGGSITEPRTEYGDSSHRQRHINILKIVSKNAASSQVGMYPLNGIPTTISLESGDGTFDPYFVLQTNVNGGPERRPTRNGKPLPVNPHHEEVIVMENGDRIQAEEVVCKLRMEPRRDAEVKGIYGDVMVMEDGTTMRLESATTIEEVDYFVTERSRENLVERYMQTEDGFSICMENDDRLVVEGVSENAVTSSFVSFGTSFNDLNIISGQQVYDIAYYIKDETDNDDFLLEDGTGVIMSEVSKPEGLRVQDMETLFPNTFIPKFSDHARDRTNLTYSAYVKSGTN